MAVIRKKIWPEWFKLIKSGKKKAELRLADFQIKAGDVLILEEWNPKKKKYTGKSIKRKIKRINKFNLLDFHQAREIKKYGCYLIEF